MQQVTTDDLEQVCSIFKVGIQTNIATQHETVNEPQKQSMSKI